ncbi:hypothetical protein IQ254_11780 [Nodosilinea sp. LEGE 07088]|uniref:hypothetical protein n=1 Tax=Nodosilinea sp. LEGE 07088 TaxID=2777968 RepID=UPI001881E933|nr:hypothetical protein [Nodosilinea sp. LEGE 07088]MBE9137864.1 hypothetical protein [Nodosilinea sp. LEGE 07088]
MLMLPTTEAETLAMSFLMEDLEILPENHDFFSVLSTRETGSEWYVVEIGVEGLPDRWVLQVFDTGQCDPCYTFVSPMPAGEDADLQEFPEDIAQAVAADRAGNRA